MADAQPKEAVVIDDVWKARVCAGATPSQIYKAAGVCDGSPQLPLPHP